MIGSSIMTTTIPPSGITKHVTGTATTLATRRQNEAVRRTAKADMMAEANHMINGPMPLIEAARYTYLTSAFCSHGAKGQSVTMEFARLCMKDIQASSVLVDVKTFQSMMRQKKAIAAGKRVGESNMQEHATVPLSNQTAWQAKLACRVAKHTLKAITQRLHVCPSPMIELALYDHLVSAFYGIGARKHICTLKAACQCLEAISIGNDPMTLAQFTAITRRGHTNFGVPSTPPVSVSQLEALPQDGEFDMADQVSASTREAAMPSSVAMEGPAVGSLGGRSADEQAMLAGGERQASGPSGSELLAGATADAPPQVEDVMDGGAQQPCVEKKGQIATQLAIMLDDGEIDQGLVDHVTDTYIRPIRHLTTLERALTTLNCLMLMPAPMTDPHVVLDFTRAYKAYRYFDPPKGFPPSSLEFFEDIVDNPLLLPKCISVKSWHKAVRSSTDHAYDRLNSYNFTFVSKTGNWLKERIYFASDVPEHAFGYAESPYFTPDSRHVRNRLRAITGAIGRICMAYEFGHDTGLWRAVERGIRTEENASASAQDFAANILTNLESTIMFFEVTSITDAVADVNDFGDRLIADGKNAVSSGGAVLTSKLFKHAANLSSTCWNDFVSPVGGDAPDGPFSGLYKTCLFEKTFRHFKASYDAYQDRKQRGVASPSAPKYLTLRGIVEKCTGKSWDGRDTAGTPNQLKMWLASVRLFVLFIDKTGHPLWWFYPKKPHTDIIEGVTFRHDNGHVETVENANKFEQSAAYKASKVIRNQSSFLRPDMEKVLQNRDLDSLVKVPSKHFPVKCEFTFGEEEVELIGPRDVHRAVMSHIINMPTGDLPYKKVIYVENAQDEITGTTRGLTDLYLELLKAGVEPTVDTKSGCNVTSLRFPWMDVPGRGKLLLTLKVPCNIPGYVGAAVGTADILKKVNEARAEFAGLLMSKANLSYYTDEELLIMENEKIPIPAGCIDTEYKTGRKVAMMDRHKDYPTSLRDLSAIPVDTKFFLWEPFDGVIKDTYFYRVEILKKCPVIPVKYTRMHAPLLRYVMEDLGTELPSLKGMVNIREQKELLSTPIDKTRKFVDELFSETDKQEDDSGSQSVSTTVEYSTSSVEKQTSKYAGIPMPLRKAASVAPIGETGRKYNKNRLTLSFKSKADAFTYSRTVKGSCPMPVRHTGEEGYHLDGCQIREENDFADAYDDEEDGLDADSDYGSDDGNYYEASLPRKKSPFVESEPACYFVTAIRQTLLTDGFRIIREFVLANSLLAVLKLYVMLIKDGIKVLAFKTDAIFFEIPSDWESIKEKYVAMVGEHAGSYSLDEDLAGHGQSKGISYSDNRLGASKQPAKHVRKLVDRATETAVMMDCEDASRELRPERMREAERAVRERLYGRGV